MIEQTGGGDRCLVAMLEARLDESGVFILREKIKSWATMGQKKEKEKKNKPKGIVAIPTREAVDILQ